MAKRKRLTPARPDAAPAAEAPMPRGAPFAQAPIASVARDGAEAAALSELAETLRTARAEGRMVLSLPLDAVDPAYLVRDRLAVDEDEMRALMDSLAARGQQTPIEVAETGPDSYGLISGWRRLEALRRLDRPRVLALVRRPAEAAEAYQAMVEENEIRAGLSHYERARIVAMAMDRALFDRDKDALQTLFGNASRSKRSKIKSFLGVVRALDGALAFPHAMGERLGLALAHALEDDPGLGPRLAADLRAAPPATAEAEAARIQRALRPTPAPRPAPPGIGPGERCRLAEGIEMAVAPDGSVTLTGPGLDAAARRRILRAFGADGTGRP